MSRAFLSGPFLVFGMMMMTTMEGERGGNMSDEEVSVWRSGMVT